MRWIEKEAITVMEHAIDVDPRRLPAVQLSRLGVELLNKYDLALRCMTCGEIWSPELDSDGKLRPGYWVCPKKCNQ